ncbi:OmpA family protein [Foetidibacter luteolus]|uniref:OmpA family protein n=1 Tax=Foetidibacter luteolus TaxID=2608880 RepID=UPI00129A138E|nr:OmpA family protein [Foetidibacter luteolus]
MKKGFLVGITAIAFMISSCSTWNKSQKGAAVGAGGGAVVGGVIGKMTGNTALGAIIGATVGGAAGAVIGKKMDKQAAEIKNEIPGAKVERVEEGIVVEFNSKVLFALNSFALTSASEASLNDLVTILNKYPDTNIEVQGHTDNTGADAYNMTLSEKRAGSVAAYLKSHNIAPSRVTTKGFGESTPKYDNNTEEGRANNRRVEFLITANEKMKTDAAKEAQQ